MPHPIFDKEQYELRGRVPAVYTQEQAAKLAEVLSRVNGQLDWNAQLLGFNGPGYWGSRIPTTDGSYQWKGLPETVSEKRALQATAFGVYNKDKEYQDRPAPFNRSEVGASADLAFDVFEQDGRTRVVPFGLPRDLLYEDTPKLIVGGEYVFNGAIRAEASGSQDSILVTQDLAQGISSLRILEDSSSSVFISLDGSSATPFIFFLENWEDISDWTSDQILNQYIGLWGNKGNWLSSHAMLDALDVHGFSEERGLSLDDILKELSITALLELIGLSPAAASPFNTSHYNFKVEGCDDLYAPTVSLETKITLLQTQDLFDLETEFGDILSIESTECENLVPAPINLIPDTPSGSVSIIDNGTLEDTTPVLDTLDNGDYPSTATGVVEDGGFFVGDTPDFITEDGKEITVDDASIYNKPCFLPPDPEFGECETPNFKLTLRQTFDTDPNGIAIDPGPGVSTPIGCNGFLLLFPPDSSDINNGEYEGQNAQFELDGGDLDFPVIPENTVSEGIYDRNPYADDPDSVGFDYERIIDYDDLIIDIAGEPGPILMSDPATDVEIVLAAAGTPEDGYDGFEIGFDGLELSTVSFEYNAKTQLGGYTFPCVEWVFDPTLDNSTYFPVADEAPWMGADDGEYDERPELDAVEYASQSDVECTNALFIAGFLAFDDGVYDEKIQPFCIPSSKPACPVADGGYYMFGKPPEPPICESECGTLDNGAYIFGKIPYLGPTSIDGLGSANIRDDCVLYDGDEYDRIASPETSCVGYDNGILGEFNEITCVLRDREFFEAEPQFTEDQGEYSDSYVPVVCFPCGVEPPDPQCYLDNGTIENFSPSSTEDEGFYDKGDLECVPCDPEPDLPIPCPVPLIRVRLDQFIFSSPAWRMRPTVSNAKVPLRLWKNRPLNVPDTDPVSPYANQLIADENSSADEIFSYRHFARLPVEYARDSKFWNRAQAALSNQSYFSQLKPPSDTFQAPLDIRPYLYDEVYAVASEDIPNSAVFYVEDFLVSQISDRDADAQSGFVEASINFEDPKDSKPFDVATVVDYDAYDSRLLRPDGTRAGRYLKWSGRCCRLSGYLESDVSRNLLRYTQASEQILGDASVFIAPNIEFPDDEDRARFSNFVVSYAYFVADLSAGDEPVFDPTSRYSRRDQCVLGKEDVSPSLSTENGLELASEDGDLLFSSEEEIIDVCVDTKTSYLLHEIKPLPARAPRRLGSRAPRSSFVAIKPLELEIPINSTDEIEISILTGVVEPYFFRWQALFGPNTAWVNLTDGATFSGVTTEKLTITPQDNFYDGALIRVAVDSDLGYTYAVSEPCFLDVIELLIIITDQPDDQQVTVLHPAVFTVEATTNDGGDLSYLWQFNCGNGWIDLEDPYDNGNYDIPTAAADTVDNGDYPITTTPTAFISDDGLPMQAHITGATTPALTVVPLDSSVDECEFRVRIQSTGGAPEVFSREALLEILAGEITVTGPEDLYLNTREEGFFSVTATSTDGGNLSYEWQVDTGSGYVTIPVSEFVGKLFDDGLVGEQLPPEELTTEADLEITTETDDLIGSNFTGAVGDSVDNGFDDGTFPTSTLSDEEYNQKVSFFPEGSNLRVIALTSDAVNYRVRCIVSSDSTAPSAISDGTGRLVIYGQGIYITTQPKDISSTQIPTTIYDNTTYDVSFVATGSLNNDSYPLTVTPTDTIIDDGNAITTTQPPRLRELYNFYVQAYTDDGGSLSYQWQIDRKDGSGWANITRDDLRGFILDDGLFGTNYVPEEILTEALENLLDELGRILGTNDTGSIKEPAYDAGIYDTPGATETISDELYDIIIATYPEKPFLFVRAFSTLANGYEFRCLITSSTPLIPGATTDVARISSLQP